MNKHIYTIIYLLLNASLCYTMDAPQQHPLSLMQLAKTTHTHPTFEFFGTKLNQSDRRNWRAADKSIWETTQMPEKLENCATKQQTNCAFLTAVHYAPLKRVENHKLIQWLLDYRKDQQFSCYMKIDLHDKLKEYHINPQFIAQTNSDEKTLKLLQHHSFQQNKITTGIFYIPSPLLWACMSNATELIEVAILNQKEVNELINENPEYILDCIRVAQQNNNSNDTTIVDILLKNRTIKDIYIAAQSPHTLAVVTNKALESTTQNKQKRDTSKIKKIKNKVKKYL